MRKTSFLVAVMVALLATLPQLAVIQNATASSAKITQPAQATSGPGGSDYTYGSVTAQHYGAAPDGAAPATGYWIFEPADSTDSIPAEGLPLILFFHGFYGTNPVHYRAWIDHIVRRGAVVVYPDYQPQGSALDALCQSGCSESQVPTLPNALAGIRASLTELATGTHVKVDLSKVAATGHSWGAMMSAKYAAVASAEGLPVPAAIMPAMPGCDCDFDQGLETIGATTRVIIIVGERDTLAGESGAKALWAGMTSVPLANRDYVKVMQDSHGVPALSANHPLTATDNDWGPLNSYDWYGPWKLFDMLTACAWNNDGCDTAMNNSPEERYMGVWSDGTPVTELEITDGPEA